MGNWSPPTTSRKQVTKAGVRISQNKETFDDVTTLEKWRAAHAYVINTFQANLRRRSRGTEIIVGTRLKRRATILNKLKRYPDMQLGRMHDIAGCRVIFPSLEELITFRREFHSARFAHKRKHIDDDRWNYLIHPKEDGYRGVHDVYEYNVRSDSGLAFNGLLVEVQYRTLLQHSWATAVEVAGLLTHNNPKFGQGSPDVIEFFAIASEVLARIYEYSTSCYPDKTVSELVSSLKSLERDTRVLELFRRVNSKMVSIDFKKNNILIFPLVATARENQSDLTILSFDNVYRAIDRYNYIERQYQGQADVVLVRADSFDNMRVTFRNYFADTTDFVDYLDEAIKAHDAGEI